VLFITIIDCLIGKRLHCSRKVFATQNSKPSPFIKPLYTEAISMLLIVYVGNILSLLLARLYNVYRTSATLEGAQPVFRILVFESIPDLFINIS